VGVGVCVVVGVAVDVCAAVGVDVAVDVDVAVGAGVAVPFCAVIGSAKANGPSPITRIAPPTAIKDTISMPAVSMQ
jgi:hypothetical protein